MQFRSLLASAALLTSVSAFPHIWNSPNDAVVARSTSPELEAKSSIHKRCTNSADDRSCWGDYDISTNYYDESPDTGVTREFWWDITNTTASPDGIERIILAINGTVPGPTIYADWGDQIGKSPTSSIFIMHY